MCGAIVSDLHGIPIVRCDCPGFTQPVKTPSVIPAKAGMTVPFIAFVQDQKSRFAQAIYRLNTLTGCSIPSADTSPRPSRFPSGP